MKASQEYQLKVNEMKLSKSPKYSIGDYALISYPGAVSDKLMSQWKVPFIITDIKSQTLSRFS